MINDQTVSTRMAFFRTDIGRSQPQGSADRLHRRNVWHRLDGAGVRDGGRAGLVGVVTAERVPSIPAAAGLAVGGAILAMSLLRCLHPPGGAAALTAVIGGKSVAALGLLFPIIPVGVNSLLLVLVGLAFHRLSGHSYPHRAIPAAGHSIAPVTSLDIQGSDIDYALDDLGETFDISRVDLELLVRQIEYHATERRALRV